MQSIIFFSGSAQSIFTNDTASVTLLLQLFFPVDLLNFVAHDTDFGRWRIQCYSKLYLLVIFLFYANIWNIFSGGTFTKSGVKRCNFHVVGNNGSA